MRVFIAFLMLVAGLGASAQVVSRNELRNTNTAILNATVRNNNGRATNLTSSGTFTNNGFTQYKTANTNTFRVGGNGKEFTIYDNVSGISWFLYDHALDKLDLTLGTLEVIGTIKAQNFQSAFGNNGSTVTDGGAVFENGMLISGVPGQGKLDSGNRIVLTTGANLSAVAGTNTTPVTLVWSNGVKSITTNLVFGSNVVHEFLPGAGWTNSANIVRIDGLIIAPHDQQIFYGAGTWSFSNNVRQCDFYVDWFGAKGINGDVVESTVNNAAEMQKAIDSAPKNNATVHWTPTLNKNYGGYFVVSNKTGITLDGGSYGLTYSSFPKAGIGYTGPSDTNNAHRGAVIYVVNSPGIIIKNFVIDMTTPNSYTMTNVARHGILFDQTAEHIDITTMGHMENVAVRNLATNDAAEAISIAKSWANCEGITGKRIALFGTQKRGTGLAIGESSNALNEHFENLTVTGWSNGVYVGNGGFTWKGGIGGANQHSLALYGWIEPPVLEQIRWESSSNCVHVYAGVSGGSASPFTIRNNSFAGTEAWNTNNALIQFDSLVQNFIFEGNVFDGTANQKVFGLSGSGVSSAITTRANKWTSLNIERIGLLEFLGGVTFINEQFKTNSSSSISGSGDGMYAFDAINNTTFEVVGPFTNSAGLKGARVTGSAGLIATAVTTGTNVPQNVSESTPFFSQGSASQGAGIFKAGSAGIALVLKDEAGNNIETHSAFASGYATYRLFGGGVAQIQLSSQSPNANYIGIPGQGFQLGIATGASPTNTLDVNGDFNVRGAAYFPVTASNNTPSSFAGFLNGKLIQTAAPAGGSGTPGGNSGAIQFTEGVSLAGTNEFNWDRTNHIAAIRNNDAAGTSYLYLGGTLSNPFYSIAADTNWFRLQYDFGTSGWILEAKRFSKFINIGSTANNTGTNFGNWYFPSNVTIGSSLGLTGPGNGSIYLGDATTVKDWATTITNVTQNISNIYVSPWPGGLGNCWKMSSTNLNSTTGFYEIRWTNGPCASGVSGDFLTNNQAASTTFTNSGVYMAVAGATTTNIDFAVRDVHTNQIAAGTDNVGILFSNLTVNRSAQIWFINDNVATNTSITLPATVIGIPQTFLAWSNSLTGIGVHTMNGKTNAYIISWSPPRTTNNFVSGQLYTNVGGCFASVEASIALTNVLASDVARMSLWLDEDGDGTFEYKGKQVRLNGLIALAGVENLFASELPPGARFAFTNDSGNAVIENNSSRWRRR